MNDTVALRLLALLVTYAREYGPYGVRASGPSMSTLTVSALAADLIDSLPSDKLAELDDLTLLEEEMETRTA